MCGNRQGTDTFVEWLAEWGREARKSQRGLLLSTAHRGKGLEFDHAIVLDGGWDQSGPNEDADASRRLYYVSMTRARHTLGLVCWEVVIPELIFEPAAVGGGRSGGTSMHQTG